MAKTYDLEAEPLATSERNQVRFLIGDVHPDHMVLQDEEIDWLLTQEANVYMAAAAAADAIVTAMSGATGTSGVITRKRVGQTDISYANGRTSKEYADLATRLRRRSGHQTLFAGGISASDKRLRELDTDRPAGRLRIGQFDSPSSSTRDELLDL